MQWLHLLVLAFFMASALGQEDQTIIQTSETEENSSKQLPSPKVTESDSSPARQRPQQGPGWGGLISGLLGTITKTADVSDCPGKCLHALASLLCEEVKEDIACPSNSMRCCVDRKHLKRPNTAIDESNLETTTNYRVRPVPARTTIATTTTTRTTTTTSRPAAVASDKQDKFGDYDYTDTTSDNSSASTTSKTASSVFFAAVLCMTFYFL